MFSVCLDHFAVFSGYARILFSQHFRADGYSRLHDFHFDALRSNHMLWFVFLSFHAACHTDCVEFSFFYSRFLF